MIFLPTLLVLNHREKQMQVKNTNLQIIIAEYSKFITHLFIALNAQTFNFFAPLDSVLHKFHKWQFIIRPEQQSMLPGALLSLLENSYLSPASD